MHAMQTNHAAVHLVFQGRSNHIFLNNKKKEAPEVIAVEEKDLFMAHTNTHPDYLPAEKSELRAFSYRELLGQVLAGFTKAFGATEETRRDLRRRRYALLLG
jgi:hypothetical protein